MLRATERERGRLTTILCHIQVTDLKELAEGLTQVSQEADSFEAFDFTIAVIVLDNLSQSQEIVNDQELQNSYIQSINNLLEVNAEVVKSSQSRHASTERYTHTHTRTQNTHTHACML